MPLKRSRAPSKYIYYTLQLYFSGLSLRKTSSQRLSQFVRRNHISIWNCIQWYQPKKIIQIKRKVEFIIDETLLKVGENYVWLWIAIEPIDKIVVGIRISIERSVLVAEQFTQKLCIEYGNIRCILMVVLGIHKHVNS